MATPIKLAVYVNCDDTLVAWRIEKPIKNCWGFAIEREMKDADGVARSWVENRTGFESKPGKPGQLEESTKWPFQRFSWTDHKVNTGDTVRYRVVPIVSDGDGGLEQNLEYRSDWSPWKSLTGKVDKNFECYFNRGLAMSQFAARYLNKLAEETGEKDRDKLLRVFKAEIGKHDAPIRNFLGGELRLRMLDLLTEAKTKKQHIYGALYELEDEELISKLQDLGARAHIVLSNGSVDKAGGDQNAEGRKLLKKAKVEVHDRMVCTGSGGPLGHNKFLVIADDKGNPESVWTGSTNWTKTGLCTQINNGIYIHDTATAGIYFRQYKLLRDAGDVFPKALVDSNDAPSDVTISGKSEKIWFTRVRKKSDTEAIDEVIAQAKDAILFLMFMPGPTASLRAIRQRIKDSPDLYVQGVATQVPADGAKEAEVTTIGSSGNHRVDLKILQVEGIKYPFASWLAEVTRKEFIANIGHAIVHSKVILVDPLTNPVLIVGSHNFSNSASAKNDENFVIIKNHKGLAEAYAAHILSIYSHFRWRTTVADKQSRGEEPWGGLSESDDWQGSHLQGRSLKEMKFWVP